MLKLKSSIKNTEKKQSNERLRWPAMHNLFYLDQDYLSFGKNICFLGDIAISYERCLREYLPKCSIQQTLLQVVSTRNTSFVGL